MSNDTLRRIAALGRQIGAGVIVVEQKVREVLSISDRVCVLRNGRIVHTGPSSELLDDAALKTLYL